MLQLNARLFCFLSLFLALSFVVNAQVTVTVNAASTATPISPYIYGRNNSLSSNPGSNFTPEWTKLKDAGVTFFRESGGNNCTKYNWKEKISSHPDWYNNVYGNDWDYAVTSLQSKFPVVQGMWSFQLLGKVAKTNTANFDDWGYNSSQWWDGVNQNLAGGGTAKTSGGSKALVEGDIDMYLEDWDADETTAILPHWVDDLGLDKSKFQYWNMDNEVEIWSGTHDDVMPKQLSPEEFMQKYFAVAKMARERYPDIKLVGPVTANEWQWYNWDGNIIKVGGKNYSWLEYFIKRVGEEQEASGVRLLDVLDIHFYPGSSTVSDVVQMHRVFFDKDYDFPEANGLKKINGGYDNALTKEYIFERCKTWLDTYLPADHGVTFGVTETGVNIASNTSGMAVWYAGMLGEFMKHPEVEIFTPWSWNVGMWETLHLYSRYNKPLFISGKSTDELNVSAYPSINVAGDSITVVLVNRSTKDVKSTTVQIKGFTLDNESFNTLQLTGLPSTETFKSHTSNALKKATVSATSNAISVSLPALSIMAIQLKGTKTNEVTATEPKMDATFVDVFPNPIMADNHLQIELQKTGFAEVSLLDLNGKIHQTLLKQEIRNLPFQKEVDVSGLSKGVYFVQFNLDGRKWVKKVIKL